MKYPLKEMLEEIQRDQRVGQGGQAQPLTQEEIRQRILRRREAEQERRPAP